MSFEKERAFGIIKIEGKSIRLYTSNNSYSTINVGIPTKDARWVGVELVIYLESGKIRKYKTQTSYSTIV